MDQIDPYKVLGVSPLASLSDIRVEFRKAVLQCHPDQHRSEDPEAERKLRELIDAYKLILQKLAASQSIPRSYDFSGEKRFSPQDLALREVEWIFATSGMGQNVPMDFSAGTGDPKAARKVSYATVNEPKLFMIFWILSVVVSLVVVYLLFFFGAMGNLGRPATAWETAWSVLVAMGIYVAILGGTLAGLVYSRRIFWYALRLATRKMLPIPKKQHPFPLAPEHRLKDEP